MQENNRSELERFDRERHDDFLGMLKGFVINQVLLDCFFEVISSDKTFCSPMNLLTFCLSSMTITGL